MPHCTLDDVRIYYESHGSGPALLLISGLGGGAWSWYGQVPFFERYYHTICFDNRGAGRSSMPAGPYRMAELAQDALGLLDHLGLAQSFVLAISMGGMIALELACRAPERVRGLVLASTHCGGADRTAPKPAVIDSLLHPEGHTPEEILRHNLPLFFSERFLQEQPDRIEAYCRAQLSVPVQPEAAFLAQFAAIRDYDRSVDTCRIPIPTLILTGDRDILVPPENATCLAQKIRGSRLVTIPGAGHALHVECTERLNAEAHAFFASCLTAG